jgi:cytochrome oxidase Cu insertion factor (SCO1/SenC/PrrC family)
MADLSNTQSPVSEKKAQISGRKIFIIMALIFALPFTVAATLHLLNLKPASHSYGNLVQPVIALKAPVLNDAQGKPFASQQWLKKWSIVSVYADSCEAGCQAQVHLLKQVHIAMNKDIKRIQRVLLMPVTVNADVLSGLQKQYPDLVILAGADAATTEFSKQFNLPINDVSKNLAGRIYLVDPLGNLMMTYPADLNPKGLRSDLTRLLKNSWAG